MRKRAYIVRELLKLFWIKRANTLDYLVKIFEDRKTFFWKALSIKKGRKFFVRGGRRVFTGGWLFLGVMSFCGWTRGFRGAYFFRWTWVFRAIFSWRFTTGGGVVFPGRFFFTVYVIFFRALCGFFFLRLFGYFAKFFRNKCNELFFFLKKIKV